MPQLSRIWLDSQKTFGAMSMATTPGTNTDESAVHVVINFDTPIESVRSAGAEETGVALRIHPWMAFRGQPSWPPAWLCFAGEANTNAKGEVGILRAARWASRTASLADRCFLIVEHENALYIGCLFFDEEWFCQRVFLKFQSHIGEPIQQIGGLKLPHSLERISRGSRKNG
jgi:hypothetical protein